MKAKPTTIQGMLLTAWVLSAGCSSSNFAGNSPAKSSASVAGAPGTGDGLPTGLPAGGEDHSNDSNNGAGSGGPGGGGPSNNGLGNGSGSAGTITNSGDCSSSNSSLSYNIVFAFDNTGSQKDTDPTNVRVPVAKPSSISFWPMYKPIQKLRSI